MSQEKSESEAIRSDTSEAARKQHEVSASFVGFAYVEASRGISTVGDCRVCGEERVLTVFFRYGLFCFALPCFVLFCCVVLFGFALFCFFPKLIELLDVPCAAFGPPTRWDAFNRSDFGCLLRPPPPRRKGLPAVRYST